MVDIAWKNIKRRKIMSILIILGVTACIHLMVILLCMTIGRTKEMHKELSIYAGKIFIQASGPEGIGGEFPPFSSRISSSILQDVLKINHINSESTIPLLFVSVVPPSFPGAPPEVLAVGIPPGKEKIYTGDLEGIGELFFSISDEKAVILSSGAAKYYMKEKGDKISVGDNIIIGEELFVVKGVLKKQNIPTFDHMILIPLSYAQELFECRSSISCILVRAESKTEGMIDEVASTLKENFPNLVVITDKENVKHTNEILAEMRRFFGLIGGSVKATSVVMILVIMILAINARTKEIGTLRAIGATRRTILFTVIQESLILSLVAAVLGLIVSYLLMKFVYNNANYFNLQVVLEIIGTAVIIGVVGGLYPAIRAVKIHPLEAIRYK
ncbi:MAG: FtsX-like permease family protein [bacterium]